MMLNTPCTAAMQNMVTPKCRLLYNNGKNFLFSLASGPMGEGKIIDGCITCPWHGFQYLPKNGQSPPPFKEMVSTYDVKVNEGKVWLNPKPYPEGTERAGAMIN